MLLLIMFAAVNDKLTAELLQHVDSLGLFFIALDLIRECQMLLLLSLNSDKV